MSIWQLITWLCSFIVIQLKSKFWKHKMLCKFLLLKQNAGGNTSKWKVIVRESWFHASFWHFFFFFCFRFFMSSVCCNLLNLPARQHNRSQANVLKFGKGSKTSRLSNQDYFTNVTHNGSTFWILHYFDLNILSN